jgi:hypothetical protein
MIAGSLVYVLQAAEPARGDAEAVAKLQKQVEDLERRVVQLELNRSLAPQVVPRAPAPPTLIDPPSTVLNPEARIPEGWKREEFNGQPYFIVPLDGRK